MTDDSIGTARLDIVVDTTQFDAAINSAKRSVSSMSQEAQRDYAQLSAAERRRVDSLIRQADTLKLTRAEQIAYNAALKGVPLSILDDLKAKLAAQEAATKGVTDANGKYVLSEKARAAAMRGVPAQITDIVSGLATGQRPLTILLQQGGQLKDMFGGIVPAAGALGRSLLALINPVTLVAGALGGLVLLWKDGADEQDGFRHALALTGNQAGQTADQLATSARDIAKQVGGTAGAAADAVTKVVQSGQFVGTQIQLVARAAVAMNRATGAAIDDTIAQFSRLADDPVKAAEALDKQFHFLTQSTKDQVAALVEQGRQQEATALLFQQYADAVSTRSKDVLDDANGMTKAFRALKDEAIGLWNAVGDALRPNTLRDDLQEQLSNLAELQAQARTGVRFRWNIDGIVDINKEIDKTKASINLIQDQLMGQDNLSVATAAANRIEADGAAGKRVLDAATKQYATTIDKYKDERQKIVDAAAAALKADPGNEKKILEDKTKALKGLDEQYQKAVDGQSRAAAALAKPGQTLIQRLQEQIAANEQDAASTDKLTASQRLRIAVEADLKAAGDKVNAADRASIKSLLDKLETTDKLNKANDDRVKATEQLARLMAQLNAQEENQRDANSADLAQYGRGSDAVEQLRRRLDIERTYTDGLKQLRDRGVAEGTESYRVQEEALRASRDRMLGVEQDYQSSRLAIMSDWRNGARRAIEDITFEAQDNASTVDSFIRDTASGLSDYIVDATTKGERSIKSFVSTLFAQAARIAANRSVATLLNWGLSFIGSGNSSGPGDALNGGSNYTGSGSLSTSWPGMTANAKGGVYDSPSLSKYSGQILSQPTFFAFAKGAALGVAGEEPGRSEAIMPLTRTSSGRLGVEAVGGGSGGTVIDVDVVVNADGSGDTTAEGDYQAFGKQLGENMRAVAQQELQRAMAPGGALWRARG
ncbi:phage tail tape measure protein, lambda family [Luteibacter sp. UNC138MFCol5.1]|uniref:phage tail tape measure protein n=1 Tax=Luteibacter sp. UNC138MFCol5.1 TaxID=1502774 RepID=UPI0008C633F5|nr:phage tail tape measure protein [Luteibacter sp. UNC138MFCol5.1]SEO63342.1 phage tail tape measure protein, lambda family [Luteibacter sp. UNC138MFCol5.1]